MNDNKKNIKKWMSWFTFFAGMILIYKLLDNFSQIGSWFEKFFSVIMPFIIGVLISYILYLPCKKVEELFNKIKIIRKKSRILSVFCVYLIVIIFVMLTFRFLVPVISQSFMDLKDNFQNYFNMAMQKISELPDNSILKSDAVTKLANDVQNIDLKQFINIETIFQYAQGAINFASGIFSFFVALIVSVYILLERREILGFAKKLTGAIFEKNVYDNISYYFGKTNEVFFKFLASQLIDAIIVGILSSIAMSIMNVKYAVLLGFMIGLFNMIPYFGAIIAITIAIIITLLTGGLPQAIWLAIVIIILQQIDANIINPKIVGESLKISPILVMLSVTIGGAYFGVLGMFLAVPIIAVFKIILLDFIEYRNNKKKISV